mmetsp:Transcript_13366/g.31812  ORF Transcript_13366/g.31812 Transcript_13366/m.31812 type:complete len:247 (-) Transcript_13366:165-905(-)
MIFGTGASLSLKVLMMSSSLKMQLLVTTVMVRFAIGSKRSSRKVAPSNAATADAGIGATFAFFLELLGVELLPLADSVVAGLGGSAKILMPNLDKTMRRMILTMARAQCRIEGYDVGRYTEIPSISPPPLNLRGPPPPFNRNALLFSCVAAPSSPPSVAWLRPITALSPSRSNRRAHRLFVRCTSLRRFLLLSALFLVILRTASLSRRSSPKRLMASSVGERVLPFFTGTAPSRPTDSGLNLSLPL